MGGAWVNGYRRAKAAREAFVARLDDMVVVLAVQILHMHGRARRLREGLKPLLEKLGIHFTKLGFAEIHPPNQVGAVGQIQRHPRQRLVHRHQGAAVARDAAAGRRALAQRLLQ